MPAAGLTRGGTGRRRRRGCARASAPALLILGLALGLAAVPSPATAGGELRGGFSWREDDGRRHHVAPFGVLRRGLLDHRHRLLEPPLDVRDLKPRRRITVPPLTVGRGFDRFRWEEDPPATIYRRALSPGAVVDRLLRRGFERVRLVRVEPGLFRMDAVDPAGRRVALLVDSLTGRVLRARIIGG